MLSQEMIEDVEILCSPFPENYQNTLVQMDQMVNAVIHHTGKEKVWFLEYPSLYTAGRLAQDRDLRNPKLLPVHKTGRGGQYTYHGPGQRVIYLILHLKRNKNQPDIKRYVRTLECWVITALSNLGIECHTREEYPGVWHASGKIASIGLRVRKWVAFHGLAINVNTDLSYFEGIVPCGIQEKNPMSSIHSFNKTLTLSSIDAQLLKTLPQTLASI